MKSGWTILRFLRNRLLQALLLVLLGVAIGAPASHFLWKDHTASPTGSPGTPLRSGPWGELYYVPFMIAAPEELLPIRAIEEGGTHWLFKNTNAAELTHLLNSADLPDELQSALLDPAIAHATPAGIDLTPSAETVIALPPKARQLIYRYLAQFPENRSVFTFIHKSALSDRFEGSEISRQTRNLFESLCCEHGEYLVFGGLPALLSQLPAYDEKVRFMKALTRQKTMLLRLHVTPKTDLNSLAVYWSRGPWGSNARTFLESIQDIPGGTFTNVMTLLPPEPASHLYDYPLIKPINAQGLQPNLDCHWTSLNFFRAADDAQTVDPVSFAREIADHYAPISGDPRYGDILIFAKPDAEIVHSAVFIADDIVFTKNGGTPIFPWMFSTVSDLRKQYSFLAPDDQQLSLTYFRSKEF